MREALHWILRSIPAYPRLLIAAAVSAAAILGSGVLSGVLKRRSGWPTGYTRKLFHFFIFFAAVGLHIWAGMPAVNVLGVAMGIYVVLIVRAGDGNIFFEALAREKDSPRRGDFIILPYLTTALGGLASNILFGACALMGYVVCGAADAIAEPVGVRFGRHRFRVASMKRVQAAERSVEGSLSIMAVSTVLATILFSVYYQLPILSALFSSILLSAFVSVVEAVSPHGADNLTVQVTASGLAFIIMQIVK